MHVPTYVGVAVIEVAVPFSAVLATDVGISGWDGGERVALPYRYGPDRLFPVPRQRGVTLRKAQTHPTQILSQEAKKDKKNKKKSQFEAHFKRI